ncbi:hypothetical protein GWI33_009525 [Rhynchophorus ferrugineus]|uniref:P21-activated protein kinase-interacting protein 1-like protein n=1 Tax=Rhynchophorus ferrugineus TaxID=354439 RepID=A0A834I9H4_RHYFE|nr:hypothetical protein GWI33_009525 [Rhynchophorus ferrugineus]
MQDDISFEIIAGTYEEYLLGYIFSPQRKKLVQSVASHDHSGSIRALATCDHYLASGAADDRIIIYDFKTRKEHCMLTHHESTITSLAFTNNHSHIISAAQDGSLAIVRVGNWQLEKLWEKAHKGSSILDIAVHSSGKLALTLGGDYTVKTWNLIKGRVAYTINVYPKCQDPKSLEKILFAPDDTRFILQGGKYTEIWSIKVGGVLTVIKHEEKVTCSSWIDNDTICVGYEDGKLAIWEIEDQKQKVFQQAHSGRVKAVQYYQGYIITASSSGQIKVWTTKLKEISSVETDCRITCLTVAQWNETVKEEEVTEIEESEKVTVEPKKRAVIVEVETSSDEEIVVKKRKKDEEEDSEIPAEEVASTENTKKLKKKTKKKKKQKNV